MLTQSDELPPVAAAKPGAGERSLRRSNSEVVSFRSKGPNGRSGGIGSSLDTEKAGIYALGSKERPDNSLIAGDGNSGDLPISPGVVLFLDVDGVLHPSHCNSERMQFNAECLSLLRGVIQATGAQIVLSTAWRLDPAARRIVGEKLVAHGLPMFVGRTANIDTFHRSREILAWVRKYEPKRWVAVDDWPLLQETERMRGHFVQTRPRFGLQRPTADEIIQLFNMQAEA